MSSGVNFKFTAAATGDRFISSASNGTLAVWQYPVQTEDVTAGTTLPRRKGREHVATVVTPAVIMMILTMIVINVSLQSTPGIHSHSIVTHAVMMVSDGAGSPSLARSRGECSTIHSSSGLEKKGGDVNFSFPFQIIHNRLNVHCEGVNKRLNIGFQLSDGNIIRMSTHFESMNI